MAPASYTSVLAQVEQLRALARATDDRGEDKLQGSLMLLCTARECWRVLKGNKGENSKDKGGGAASGQRKRGANAKDQNKTAAKKAKK